MQNLEGPKTNTPEEVSGAEEVAYMQEIGGFFLALRGTGLFLSPLDTGQILDWMEAGLPLSVVLRGLNRGASRLQAKKKPLRSLRKLKRYVTQEYKKYCKINGLSQPQKKYEGPVELLLNDRDSTQLCDTMLQAIEAHQQRLTQLHNEPWACCGEINLAEKAFQDLEALKSPDNWGAGGPIPALLELGRRFYRDLLAGLAENEVEVLQTAAQEALRGFEGSMSESSRLETLEELQITLLRERIRLFEPTELLALWDE